jgi:ABC-type microcin C transport system permease subunit YejB|tara:strand:+ start:437 stop:631 length:195 start_codon:yes stop_codon:yes gene_type:complete
MNESPSGSTSYGQDKVKFDDLVAGIKEDYKVNGKRSLDTVLHCVKHLERYFGFDKAMDDRAIQG